MIASLPGRSSITMRWLLFGVLALGVLSISAGRGTLAFFTSSASSTSNSFTAGTLVVQVADVNETTFSNAITASVSGSTLAPGSLTTGFIEVKNTGSLDLRYALTTADTTLASTPNTALDNALTVGVDTRAIGTACTAAQGGLGQTQVVAAGAALKTLQIGDPAQGAQAGDRPLAPNAGERLCLYVTFPLGVSADNAPQGGSASYSFTVAAEQTANN